MRLAALVFALLASPAFAHAFLERADPRVGSTVDKPPARVTLQFTEALEPAFSTLKVVDAAGHEVDSGDKQVDPKDRRMMSVSVRALKPGAYKVIWRALSADTHVTQGDFKFEVRR
jgi:methionine-rich copper-binding protein CopC